MQQQQSPSLQQQQQQQQQQRRTKHAKHTSQIPGPAPYPQYLRILFPRHLQLRETVPQLLSQPHPDLDAEAYHFLAFLVRDFIQTWYSSFSSDPQLVTSIVDVVIHIARTLEQRNQEVPSYQGAVLLDISPGQCACFNTPESMDFFRIYPGRLGRPLAAGCPRGAEAALCELSAGDPNVRDSIRA